MSKRKLELLADDETDRLYNQLAAGEPIPGLSFNLMLLGRGFARQPGFWKPLIRCIAAARDGDRPAKRILDDLDDLADRFRVYLLSDEGRGEDGYRPWSPSWHNEWSGLARRLTDWHGRRGGRGSEVRAGAEAPESLPDMLPFPSNPITTAVVSAFSAPQLWGVSPIDLFSVATTRRSPHKHLDLMIGVGPIEPFAEVWDHLRSCGPQLVKAHYALWAHWQAQGARAGDRIRIDINQFCHDLGYTKHHNGGFQRRDKQRTIKTLKTLTVIELDATFRLPDGSQGRLQGPLWHLGLIALTRRLPAASPGPGPAEDEAGWGPVAFSYSPGDWFWDESYRARVFSISKIGSGLLRLDSQNDRWAILIAGYLGTLQWRNQKTFPLSVETILQRTGLGQGLEAFRRDSETREYFLRALERLRQEFIITAYRVLEEGAIDVTNWDDPAEIENVMHRSPDARHAWRKRSVEFEIDLSRNAAAMKRARLERSGE